MSVKKMTEIKKLSTLKSKLEGELDALKDEQKLLSRQINDKNNQIENVENQIKKLKKDSNNLIVSEHALLRYIERVIGIDLDDIANNILTEEVVNQYKSLGNGTYSVNGGDFKVVIKDKTVLSILK